MRDVGASPWTLLKYLGANQNLVMGGPDCRDTIYSETIQYWNSKKQGRGREAILKVAIPVAVVVTAATLVTAGVGYLASLAGPAMGMDPSLASELWGNWKTTFSPALARAKDLLFDFESVRPP